jgi:hypothetical protein
MSDQQPSPFIPPRTREEIQNPASKGQRHGQAMRIAMSLLGQGFVPDAVFAQLRGMYPEDVTDDEISSIIKWAVQKNPLSCQSTSDIATKRIQHEIAPKRVTTGQAITNAEKWLGNFRCEEYDLWERSPWRPLEDWRFDALPLLAALYGNDDFINVVTEFTLEQQENGKQKANPHGPGRTMRRDDWMRSLRDHSAPQSDAGAWVRPNPVKQEGSGKNGAVCDRDVTGYRFCLLESDDLPLELQLSLWATLPLPVAAIIDSAGRSVHAWVMLNCQSSEEYQAKVHSIYELLARFGICRGNKNASRLSRLPGAQREIGKREDGAQKLLYLNPDPCEAPIFERKK